MRATRFNNYIDYNINCTVLAYANLDKSGDSYVCCVVFED